MTPAALKSARKALGLKPPEASKLMEVALPDLHRIEAGTRPPPVRYVALLKAYMELHHANKSS